MNLFRSEEHARHWRGFTPAAEGGLLPVRQMLAIFSAEMFRARGGADYLPRLPELRKGFLGQLRELTAGHPFWGVGG